MTRTTVLVCGLLVAATVAGAVIGRSFVKRSVYSQAATRDPAEVSRARNAFLSEPSIPLNITSDGRQLLMQMQASAGYGLAVVDRTNMRTIATVQTGSRPRLTSWSPDGHKIAYSIDGGGAEYQLWLWHLETRKAVRLQVPTTRIVTQVKWAPSGRFLTHVVERNDGSRTLYRVEAKNGALPIQVCKAITPKAGMAWAPDETGIATVRSDAPDAVTIIAFSGSERSLRLEGGMEIRDLAFSHDGRTVLLTSRRQSGQFFRLAEANLAQGTIRVMPPAPVAGDVVSPFFLPDDRGIVYRVYPGNEKVIIACHRDGLECRQLGPRTGQATPWGVSADGRNLFVGQLQPRAVQEVDMATGRSTPIYEVPLPEGVGLDGGRMDIPSFDGLKIPVHFRQGKSVPEMKPGLFVQVLGGIGKESPAPWDGKSEYLHQRGIAVLKIYVRGKAGFGRMVQDGPGGNGARVRDILAVLDHAVRVLGMPSSRIVLFGHSDGALLAAKAAAAGAPIKSLVISSMVKDPEQTSPATRRCVVAFQGSQDKLAPEAARAEIEKVLGQNTTREPCGRFQVLEKEAHEIERTESWAEVFAAVISALRTDGKD